MQSKTHQAKNDKHMTLQDVEAIKREFLTPSQVSKVLGCDQYLISWTAQRHPERLGFPVIVIGNRTKIPKAAFLRFMRGERPLNNSVKAVDI